MKSLNNGRTLLGLALLILGLLFGVKATFEPDEGPGSWLTSLAGDWTVRLAGSYVVGNAPERNGTYTVYRATMVSNATGQPLQLSIAEVNGVLECASDGEYILLRKTDGLTWRHIVSEEDAEAHWHTAADVVPDEIAHLKRELTEPSQSGRTWFFVLGAVCAIVGVAAFVLPLSSRSR